MSNKRGLVQVSLPTLARLLQMDDYHILMAEVDNNRQILKIVVSHPSLPETPEGAEVPIVGLYFTEKDQVIHRKETSYESALRAYRKECFINISLIILFLVSVALMWVIS